MPDQDPINAGQLAAAEIRALKLLKHERGQLRTALTRFETFLRSNPSSDVVAQRMRRIEGSLEKFEAVQRQINVINDVAEDEQTEVAEFEVRYDAIIFEASRVIRSASVARSENSTATTASVPETLGSSFLLPTKLPPIPVPTFSGNYLEWESFRDLFVSLVHNNRQLSNAQKFHYLKGNIRGEALALLETYEVTDSNYGDAWQKLKNCYDNKRVLLNNHWRAFVNLAPIAKESAASLKTLFNGIGRMQHALKSLNRSDAAWEDYLVFFAVERLDAATRRDWETSLGKSTDPPTFNALNDFVEGRIRTLESLPIAQPKPTSTVKPAPQQRPARIHHAAGTASNGPGCISCKGPHFLGYCPKFQALEASQRRALVAKLRVCFNCLRPGHVRDACPSSKTCSSCQERHHSSLHVNGSSSTHQQVDSTALPHRPQTSSLPSSATRSNNRGSSPSPGRAATTPSERQSVVLHAVSAPVSRVILATAIVLLRSPTGRTTKARALLDPGAEVSFISEAIVQTLRLPRRRSDLSFVGVGGSALGTGKHVVNAELISIQDPGFNINLQACVLRRMTNSLPSAAVAHADWPHLRNLRPLADPEYLRSSRIDLILGADVYGSLLLPDIRKGPSGSPTAQLTTLGWTIFGPATEIASPATQPSAAFTSCLAMATTDLPDVLQKFWEIEDVSARPPLSPDDEACEHHYASTHRRTSTGRYMVRLPLTSETLPTWTDSLSIAVNCLSRLEKRCERSPIYGDKYAQFLCEYAALGHMQLVDGNQQPTAYTPYYMPHHGVLRGNDDSGKLRVVFNASQRTRSGTSLNDHLLVGPTLQRELFDVVLSWRKHAVAVTADVEKMYRQILVDERDADLQRIVWRQEASQSIRHFRLTTVTYGTACAPYLAIRTLMQLATDEHHRFPRAAEVLRHQSYVDDILFGADDLESARELRDELVDLLRAGGFELRKWASTHSKLLSDFPADWLQPSTSRSFDDGCIRALGLEWSTRLDTFCFQVTLQPETTAPTKRSMLSTIAKLFDPMGWLAPAIVVGKIMIQDLWLAGVDWDAPLSDQLAASWRTFVEDLPCLEDIAIPRWIGWTSCEANSYQLHGFADALSRAYAAVVYLRTCSPSGTTVTLLAAKTKVAPVKQLSIPRLELCGAVLVSRLMTRVRSALGMAAVSIFLWSDSQVVLAWIRAHASRWTTFVANRVSTVQSALPDAQWKHVPTKDNPADLASRGVSPAALSAMTLWWNGPCWLREDSCHWPANVDADSTDLEVRSKAVHTTIVNPTWELMSKFSSATKLWRVTAWCLRFVSNCRARQRIAGPLTAAELHAARMVCLRTVQAAAFSEEIAALSSDEEVPRRSPLRKLRPFIDQNGILRVGGRLQRSLLDYEGRHPALLPKRSPLTSLLVADAHRRTLHGGTLTTLNLLMTSYWILGCKDLVRGHIHRCAKCTRLRASVVTPVMGDLPASRVTATRPFLRSGVDYAGPIQLRTTKGRGHKSTKGYIALFVCLWSKAIHLEVVSDYSTAAFLAAFKRFVSRRGICRELLSDNGTTFHGADAELRRLFSEASTFHQDVAELIANDGTSWTFIPPAAPHFGGLWEAGVRSTKHHLRRIIGESTLTFEELTTVLAQIEACLNSRPLTPLSSDPADLTAITPAHFLIGEPLLAVPEPSVSEVPLNRLSRWQLTTRMRDHFWRRWSSEYLHLLQQRSKWTIPGQPLQIGRLVLLKDEHLPPTRWLMGRVTAVHPGADGTVRVVTLKTATSTLKRPVVKLCPLPE